MDTNRTPSTAFRLARLVRRALTALVDHTGPEGRLYLVHAGLDVEALRARRWSANRNSIQSAGVYRERFQERIQHLAGRLVGRQVM